MESAAGWEVGRVDDVARAPAGEDIGEVGMMTTTTTAEKDTPGKRYTRQKGREHNREATKVSGDGFTWRCHKTHFFLYLQTLHTRILQARNSFYKIPPLPHAILLLRRPRSSPLVLSALTGTAAPTPHPRSSTGWARESRTSCGRTAAACSGATSCRLPNHTVSHQHLPPPAQ